MIKPEKFGQFHLVYHYTVSLNQVSLIHVGQVDFIDWMSLPPSNLIEEISPNPEALSASPKAFYHHVIAEKTKRYLSINPFMHNVWPFYNVMHERVNASI